MSRLLAFVLLLSSSLVFGHGGDDGPASLEQEFSKQSHTHLPINFSSHDGFSFGFDLGGHHEDEATEGSHEDHGVHFEAHPMISGGYDKIKRTICLEESEHDEIESCSSSARHLLFENKKWDLGLGLESHTHLPVALGVGVGVGYFKGKNYFSYRVLNSKSENRAPLSFPRTKEEFNCWRVGDQLAFMSKGSVLFSVVLGIDPFFHVGPEFTHTGIHRVLVKKTSDKTLVAEFSVIKSNSLGLEGSVLVGNVGASGSKGHSEAFSYEFNMMNEQAYLAFEYFLAARLDLLHQEIQKGIGQVILKNQLKNRGRTLSGSIAVPVLFYNGGYVGRFSVKGTMDILEEGELHPHEVYSTSKIKDHFTRGVASDHFWENSSLVTTVLREIGKNDESVISVVYNWTYSRDHFKRKQFLRKLKKLFRKTQSEKLNSILLPSGTKGYVKIDINLNLSAHDVLKVLSKKQKEVLANFQKRHDYAGLNKQLLKFMDKVLEEMPEDFHHHMEVKLEGENIKKTVLHLDHEH